VVEVVVAQVGVEVVPELLEEARTTIVSHHVVEMPRERGAELVVDRTLTGDGGRSQEECTVTLARR